MPHPLATPLSILRARWARAWRRLRAGRAPERDAAYAPRRILDAIEDAVIVVDVEDRVHTANAAALRLLGYGAEADVVGTPLSRLVMSPFNVGRASDTLMRGGSVRHRAMVWQRRDGKRLEVQGSASVLVDDRRVPSGMVYVLSEIGDRRRATEIAYHAFHDALTGLPNRTLFHDSLRTALEEEHRRAEERMPALFFLDLDGFKLVNDSLGHSVGDALLQAVARRLRQVLRQDDMICRLGGDEFTALLHLREREHADIVARKIVGAFAEPFRVEEHELYVTASVGVALYPEHGEDAETLLRSADSAMYLAKDGGKNTYHLAGEQVTKRARERFEIVKRLRRAVEQQELELHYQPLVDIATESVVGAEALLRWRRDGDLLSPARFMELAEESRLIVPIGEWVLATACRTAAGWQGRRTLQVAVNLSPAQLQDKGLIDAVATALAASGLPAHLLEVEVTETAALTNAQRTEEVLHQLRELGVHIAMDDFGTGYSSLSYLQRFPIDTVKIDQRFTRGIGHGTRDAAIIGATVNMAYALGLSVTAEGVETAEQLAFLRHCGCHRAQGFAISEPLPAESLLRFVEQPRPLPRALRRSRSELRLFPRQPATSP